MTETNTMDDRYVQHMGVEAVVGMNGNTPKEEVLNMIRPLEHALEKQGYHVTRRTDENFSDNPEDVSSRAVVFAKGGMRIRATAMYDPTHFRAQQGQACAGIDIRAHLEGEYSAGKEACIDQTALGLARNLIEFKEGEYRTEGAASVVRY